MNLKILFLLFSFLTASSSLFACSEYKESTDAPENKIENINLLNTAKYIPILLSSTAEIKNLQDAGECDCCINGICNINTCKKSHSSKCINNCKEAGRTPASTFNLKTSTHVNKIFKNSYTICSVRNIKSNIIPQLQLYIPIPSFISTSALLI